MRRNGRESEERVTEVALNRNTEDEKMIRRTEEHILRSWKDARAGGEGVPVQVRRGARGCRWREEGTG